MIHLTERQQMTMIKKQQEDQQLIINVHKRNANGETPLHVATIKVHTIILRFYFASVFVFWRYFIPLHLILNFDLCVVGQI